MLSLNVSAQQGSSRSMGFQCTVSKCTNVLQCWTQEVQSSLICYVFCVCMCGSGTSVLPVQRAIQTVQCFQRNVCALLLQTALHLLLSLGEWLRFISIFSVSYRHFSSWVKRVLTCSPAGYRLSVPAVWASDPGSSSSALLPPETDRCTAVSRRSTYYCCPLIQPLLFSLMTSTLFIHLPQSGALTHHNIILMWCCCCSRMTL